MTTASDRVTEAIAFDRGLAAFVKHTVEDSSLVDKVDIISYPERQVTEFHVRETLPFHFWSSGERSTWEFLASLSGGGEVDLHKLASRVGGSGRLAADLVAIFAVAMGLQPNG